MHAMRMLLVAIIVASLAGGWPATPVAGHPGEGAARPFRDVAGRRRPPLTVAAIERPAPAGEEGWRHASASAFESPPGGQGAAERPSSEASESGGPASQPLSDLSPQAVTYAGSRAGEVGVAVVDPRRDAVFSMNGDLALPMASVAKLAIMVTVMNAAIQEDRDLTPCETELLRRMITISDNAAATALWSEVGGGAGISAYLSSIGLSGFDLSSDSAWGESLAPPEGVAMLLAKLAAGQILTEPFREQAFALMYEVIPAQRWGVPEGVDAGASDGTYVAVKNGWYLGDEGWRVNSAAVVVSSDPQTGYAIAVMTDAQPSMGYGIQTIEEVAGEIDRSLRGP